MLITVLRAAGLVMITCPSVALAQLALTGTPPPISALLAVAVVTAVIGLISPGPARLMGQLAVAQLAGHAVVYLVLGQPATGCLPAMGRGAVAGLRLAILRPEAACGPGQYAAGPTLAATLAVLLAGAGVLLWQVLTAVAGSALLRAAARAWIAAQALAARATFVVLVLRRPFAAPVVAAPVPAIAGAVPFALTRRVIAGVLRRRGPPPLTA